MQVSTRRGISYPDLTRVDRPDVPAHLYNLVQKLDVDVLYVQGTDTARLAAGHQSQGGLLWFTTDTHLLWYDDGVNWYVISQQLTGAILASIIDAKGDLIAGTADNTPARLPVGTLGYVLTADPGTATGLSWTDKNWQTITQAAGFVSADAAAATYVMSINGVDLTSQIGVGTDIKVIQGTTRYFIVTAISYSGGNTTLTLYGGTDYILDNVIGITNVYYSNMFSPPGFPVGLDKWSVVVEDSSAHVINNPGQNNWKDTGLAIVVPIGTWLVEYHTHVKTQYSSGQGQLTISSTLSTTTNSESDTRLTGTFYAGNTSNNFDRWGIDLKRKRILSVAVKTTYHLLVRSGDANCTSISADGTVNKIVVEARSLYL